jgi:nucleotide-binding universal stress UspA family protein
LVVPPEAKDLKLNCAMVAWKESREARRAVSDALPLLRKAKEVVIAEAIEDEADRTAAHGRLDDVASWLGRHGVAASGRVFHFPGGEDPLEKLWEYGADLLVAGAYGHARLREWVFGGFTHDLLRRSLRCAFLAH